MKKIEYILGEYGFVLKTLLSIVWVLWAIQLFIPMKKTISEEMLYQETRDWEVERKETLAVRKFAKEKLKQAEAEGVFYSPEEYFQDLKDILGMVQLKKAIRPQAEISQLQQLSWINIKNEQYTMKDVEKARSVYKIWNEENLAEIESLKEITWQSALFWLTTFYWRTVFLVFFFYLARMADRNGVLETLLAEKKKFVLAIIFWPVYFFKYPYNVVREIRVEAELRRLKGLFKVFTAREAGLVREVANSSFYKQWLAGFRQQNRHNFQRGLFLALMATLLIHLLASSNLRASEKRVRSPGLILCQAENQTNTEQNLTDSTDENTHQVEEVGIAPEIGLFDPPLLLMIVEFLKKTYHSRQPDNIDCVPRFSLFGVLNIINQTVKGEKHEYGQENNLLGCLTWGRKICFCP